MGLVHPRRDRAPEGFPQLSIRTGPPAAERQHDRDRPEDITTNTQAPSMSSRADGSQADSSPMAWRVPGIFPDNVRCGNHGTLLALCLYLGAEWHRELERTPYMGSVHRERPSYPQSRPTLTRGVHSGRPCIVEPGLSWRNCQDDHNSDLWRAVGGGPAEPLEGLSPRRAGGTGCGQLGGRRPRRDPCRRRSRVKKPRRQASQR